MANIETIGRAIAEALRNIGLTNEVAIAEIVTASIETYGELGLGAIVDPEADTMARYMAWFRVEKALIAGRNVNAIRHNGTKWATVDGRVEFDNMGLVELAFRE
jgi:hypothetical protein